MQYEILLRCPQCSGYRFGSATDGQGNILHRTCNGHTFHLNPAGTIEIKGCYFQWPPEDDYKYFVVMGSFESAEEYDRKLKFITTDHILDALIEDMSDRRGFRQLLDSLDEEVKAEIRQAWSKILRWNIVQK